ncbi:MAG TPA: hypothetical protein V6D50_22985 [Chroococcales cyanobacterium]|jgi:hypothetical protein
MMSCLALQVLVAQKSPARSHFLVLAQSKALHEPQSMGVNSTSNIQDDNGLILYSTDNPVIVQRHLEGRLSLVPVT